jgi:hypothetical protein
MRDEHERTYIFPTVEAAFRAKKAIAGARDLPEDGSDEEPVEAANDLFVVLVSLGRDTADIPRIEQEGSNLHLTILLHADIDLFAGPGGPTSGDFWSALMGAIEGFGGREIAASVATASPSGVETQKMQRVDPALLDPCIEPPDLVPLQGKAHAMARATRLLELAGVLNTATACDYDYAKDAWVVTLSVYGVERKLVFQWMLGPEDSLVPALNGLMNAIERGPHFTVLLLGKNPPKKVVAYADPANLARLLAAGLKPLPPAPPPTKKKGRA